MIAASLLSFRAFPLAWAEEGIRFSIVAEKTESKLAEKMAVKTEELKKKSLVRLQTSQGEIRVRLFPGSAPKACENFITLAERGYFNGLLFHRVIKGFMIQGGDPTGTGSGGSSIWGGPFEDEFSDQLLFSRPGLLAMANAGPNTNGSQFFITTVPTPHLNRRHTIFGEVAEGMEAVRKIESTPADSQDRPIEAQKILKVSVNPN